ncbi:ubiquitin specific peptidase [Capsaspora owczarzaki ATCC 30864]|uniref:Ubiquitin carboxyl-terminal hydrolase n=1 Tax=Capsaspora owczarzaki (strain ATCC 30864) TaxID=595528 RepID=A0A0D2WPN3_CAPO3|nr:ubiquitin specific peptidase [Capsaspora owczarzaki ATCC 30864]KJE92643.1 ubiquitin specific peptidase [Capsaspora owczarzaki ATCC 30864]|eukprot:XP_004363291.1 ubiquitin specific peptidase [Capsaspora owczarzaki ATCC 30864]
MTLPETSMMRDEPGLVECGEYSAWSKQQQEQQQEQRDELPPPAFEEASPVVVGISEWSAQPSVSVSVSSNETTSELERNPSPWPASSSSPITAAALVLPGIPGIPGLPGMAKQAEASPMSMVLADSATAPTSAFTREASTRASNASKPSYSCLRPEDDDATHADGADGIHKAAGPSRMLEGDEEDENLLHSSNFRSAAVPKTQFWSASDYRAQRPRQFDVIGDTPRKSLKLRRPNSPASQGTPRPKSKARPGRIDARHGQSRRASSQTSSQGSTSRKVLSPKQRHWREIAHRPNNDNSNSDSDGHDSIRLDRFDQRLLADDSGDDALSRPGSDISEEVRRERRRAALDRGFDDNRLTSSLQRLKRPRLSDDTASWVKTIPDTFGEDDEEAALPSFLSKIEFKPQRTLASYFKPNPIDRLSQFAPPSRATAPFPGLCNIGNTCYVNSVLQPLFYTRGFSASVATSLQQFQLLERFTLSLYKDDALASEIKQQLCCLWEDTLAPGSPISPYPVARALSVLLIEMQDCLAKLNPSFAAETLGQSASVSATSSEPFFGGIDKWLRPSEFVMCLRDHHAQFSGYTQQDAQEFLRYILTCMQDFLDKMVAYVTTVANLIAPELLLHLRGDGGGGGGGATSDSVASAASLNNIQSSAVQTSPLLASLLKQAVSVFLPSTGGNVPLPAMSSLFQGKLTTSTCCFECDTRTCQSETFWDVSVPIHDRENVLPLSETLDAFTTPERLQGSNKYQCDTCRSFTEAERRILIGALPNVMTVHFKRFAFDEFNSKLSTVAALPWSMTFAEWCVDDCQGRDALYDLAAIVFHSGSGSSSGHYTAVVNLSTCKRASIDQSSFPGNIPAALGQHLASSQSAVPMALDSVNSTSAVGQSGITELDSGSSSAAPVVQADDPAKQQWALFDDSDVTALSPEQVTELVNPTSVSVSTYRPSAYIVMYVRR